MFSDVTDPAQATPQSEPAEVPRAGPTCALCKGLIPNTRPEIFINEQQVCPGCEQQVIDELEGKKPDASAYPIAAAGGLLGALAGAAVWAAIAVATNFEVGYVAVLVGFLAGYGVKLGARDKRGGGLPVLAAGLSVVGLVAAKYFIFAWFAVEGARKAGVGIGYIDPILLGKFFDFLPRMLSAFDLLWVILAIGAAYRAPASPKIRVVRVP